MQPVRPDRLRAVLASGLQTLALLLLLTCSASAADTHPGAKLYAEHCSRCHGADGNGTTDYPRPLRGDRSLGELKTLIEKTMPEDDPGACVGPDAEQVASFIHGAFYSVLAQERNRPATVELSRLTVRQHQQAVADLLAIFRGTNDAGQEHGLTGTYYKSRRRAKDDLVYTRVDPVIDFDFGTEKPAGFPPPEDLSLIQDKEKLKEAKKPENILGYSVTWEGAVLAPTTGDYEFHVECPTSVRLWVNDFGNPLIDVSVKSGDGQVYQEKIRLLGGRTYPLKLTFTRFREPHTFVRLKWKPPHQSLELIPERNLFSKAGKTTFVLETPFPPDDRSIGYERGTIISRSWDEATTSAALEAARDIVAHMPQLISGKETDADYPQKVEAFCKTYVQFAFRRPLTAEEQEFFVARFFRDQTDLKQALTRVIVLALKSPRFLYRETRHTTMDDYDIASWLSFSVWDSIPDRELMGAAQRGELKTREQIEKQVARMMKDPRSLAKQKDFLRQWLHTDRFAELEKDASLFPEFTPEVISDLRISLDLFLDDVLSSDSADFRELLLSDSMYLNGRLARFYGIDLPEDAPFQRVSMAAQARAGVLTHPLLMAGFAYDRTTSPIHRGVFLARSVLGRRLLPPPEAVSPLAPDLHAGLSTRERILLQTSPGACQTCHAMINPLGFSLENFDAVGRYREQEQDRALDTQGTYTDLSGETIEFQGPRELARFLADSPEAQGAFVQQLFQNLVKQPVRAFGPEHQTELQAEFVRRQFNIRSLAQEMVTGSALRAREIKNSKASPTDQRQSSVTRP
ncbi:DUF1592 domain-containing protein [Planctomicrobium sp. SH664]|uniref:DUF1592 domain-containing protein n=1 Tax=Planctomicrobium sp. SH664 TaxID=3448125 RepID=UPI003F5B5215